MPWPLLTHKLSLPDMLIELSSSPLFLILPEILLHLSRTTSIASSSRSLKVSSSQAISLSAATGLRTLVSMNSLWAVTDPRWELATAMSTFWKAVSGEFLITILPLCPRASLMRSVPQLACSKLVSSWSSACCSSVFSEKDMSDFRWKQTFFYILIVKFTQNLINVTL